MIYTVALNPAIDLELTVPTVELGTVLRSSGRRVDVGGKGINVARMVKRLGGDVVALGFAGGNAGHLIADVLQQEGIENDFVAVAEETRTNICIVGEKGEHIKVNEAGPHVSAGEQTELIEKVLARTRPGDWCVLSGSLPPNVSNNFYADLIQQLHDAGGKVVLDASGEALRLGCQAAPFLAAPNLAEAAELTAQTDPLRMASQIRKLGPSVAVITLGRRGALLVDDDNAEHLQPPEVVERNAVGAGDAFVGGVVYALERAWPLGDALRWGVAAGAVAAGLEGTSFGERTAVEAMSSRVRLGDLVN